MNSKTEHYHIVVTFNIDEKEKELLVKTLPEGTFFSFLSDLNEGTQILPAADLIQVLRRMLWIDRTHQRVNAQWIGIWIDIGLNIVLARDCSRLAWHEEDIASQWIISLGQHEEAGHQTDHQGPTGQRIFCFHLDQNPQFIFVVLLIKNSPSKAAPPGPCTYLL